MWKDKYTVFNININMKNKNIILCVNQPSDDLYFLYFAWEILKYSTKTKSTATIIPKDRRPSDSLQHMSQFCLRLHASK